jgi:hypothetical protein
MTKIRVTVEAEIDIEFDENSEEFKEVWQGYKEAIDRDADYESFAESIASFVSRYGVKDFFEGVGYFKYNGENQNIFNKGKYEEQPAVVNLIVATDLNDMVDFDITHTQTLQ